MNFTKALNMLYEMATIGQYDNHKVMVYTEPQGNPSFHVKYKYEWEVVLEIDSLEILEVKYGQFKKYELLPSFELKELMKFFNSSCENQPKLSNWEMIITQWNVLNPRYKIHYDTEIPNV